MKFKPAAYTVRLTTLTTGTLLVYTINLLEESPVAGDSWGSIKSLHLDR